MLSRMPLDCTVLACALVLAHCGAGYVEGTPDVCQEVSCSGHGRCEVTGGLASCACDAGYHAEGLACTADTDDKLPPSIPKGLSAAAVPSWQINLTWQASTDNVGVQGYKVHRGGAEIGDVTGTAYQDTGLAAGTYTYTVVAYDLAGNHSAESASASATVKASTDSSATMVFDSGFESGDVSDFTPHTAGGTFTAVTSPVSGGNYAGKFDLQFVSVEADNYRAETYLKNGASNFQYNTEYWFSFDYRFEDWSKDSDTETAPLQVHLRPSTWDCQLGNTWSNAPLYMYVANDTMGLNTWPAKKRWSAPIQKNKWLTITVRFIPSWGSNGLIEAWFNGTRIVSVSGQNLPRLDGCGKDHREPYFNMGIYKWNWRTGRPATQSSRRTLLVDNFKLAQGSDGYSLVSARSD